MSAVLRCTSISCLGFLGFVTLGCSSGTHGSTPSEPGDSGSPTVDATMPEDAASDAPTHPADTGTDTGIADVTDSSAPTDTGDCVLGSVGEPTELKCTGLYSDWATKTVSHDVHQYDPGLHLWSDGAVKTRWIYLPPNAADSGRARIDTSNMDEWAFPVGTKLWKEFALGGKRIETRLLWKQDGGSWYLTTYKWSPDETMATEFTDGELDADGTGYEIPPQYACMQCHGGRQDIILGFEAVSLASAGATPVTMASLVDAGWLTQAPDASLVIPGNATDVAALGYLHANCGIACHNRGSGGALATGFYMRLTAGKLGSVQATDTWTTGVNQLGRFTVPGDTLPLMRLAPYDAGGSCAHYRMSKRTGVDDAGPGLQMPQIDSHKVDEAGLGMIITWIDQGCQ